MVGGQVVVDRPPCGGLMIPRGHGEAIEVGVIPGRDGADRHEAVDRAARRIRPPMVLRSRWESHEARAPFVEGAGFASAILRRRSPLRYVPQNPRKAGRSPKERGYPCGGARR